MVGTAGQCALRWGVALKIDIPTIFEHMPSRYIAGATETNKSFYFSIGDHKFTVKVDPKTCQVEPGKTVDQADIVLKTTPELFLKMVVHGKMPSPLDIARGKIKTNDPRGLATLKSMFDFSEV